MFNDLLKEFCAPLSPDEIEWKIQGVTNNKDKTIIVPYMNNRAVMTRLDNCFGANNWSAKFTHINYQFSKSSKKDGPRVENGLGTVCELSIKTGNEWITKSDGADATHIEPFKGGISDAMKRAATQWGMGRDLYDYPKIFLEGAHFYIPPQTMSLLNQMVVKKNTQGLEKDVVVLPNPNK